MKLFINDRVPNYVQTYVQRIGNSKLAQYNFLCSMNVEKEHETLLSYVVSELINRPISVVRKVNYKRIILP